MPLQLQFECIDISFIYYLINFTLEIGCDLTEMDKLHDFIMNMNIFSENYVDIIRYQVDNIKIMLPTC